MKTAYLIFTVGLLFGSGAVAATDADGVVAKGTGLFGQVAAYLYVFSLSCLPLALGCAWSYALVSWSRFRCV